MLNSNLYVLYNLAESVFHKWSSINQVLSVECLFLCLWCLLYIEWNRNSFSLCRKRKCHLTGFMMYSPGHWKLHKKSCVLKLYLVCWFLIRYTPLNKLYSKYFLYYSGRIWLVPYCYKFIQEQWRKQIQPGHWNWLFLCWHHPSIRQYCAPCHTRQLTKRLVQYDLKEEIMSLKQQQHFGGIKWVSCQV